MFGLKEIKKLCCKLGWNSVHFTWSRTNKKVTQFLC